MRKTRFLIGSLLAAGFGTVDDTQAIFTKATTAGGGDPGSQDLLRLFKLDHKYSLAQHRSHRSHSSHSSHRSSSGGGSSVYSYPPLPTYSTPLATPTPAPAPRARSRSLYMPSPGSAAPTVDPAPSRARVPAAPQMLRGGTERFTSIVRRVQLGLLAYGYYEGPIDGIVGAPVKAALRRFQTDFKIPVTGTITPETLDALRIAAE